MTAYGFYAVLSCNARIGDYRLCFRRGKVPTPPQTAVCVYDNSRHNGAEVIVSSGDTASMFGNGGIELALIFLSLLAASGILAYILKKRKE